MKQYVAQRYTRYIHLRLPIAEALEASNPKSEIGNQA